MIIVGVDGSRAGLEAVGWAAREAAIRQTELSVVHALPRWVCERDDGRYAEVAAWMRRGGRELLDAGEERARREGRDVKVTVALLPGDPRTALVRASQDAELLVVGSHGIGGVRGLLVGSVAHGVVGRAACDTVVVGALPSPPRGEIVVGVDGSYRSRLVLAAAFAEAGRRGATLRAVHAWAWPRPDGFEPADPGREDGALILLKEALAGHGEPYPEVPVVAEVVHGHPAEVLRQAATGADLLMVGSHGHGAFAGMGLGSISQELLHRTPCPLWVVPAAAAGRS
ncbi:universal stress protein [Nonomuraea gerenzanensis]|uniref:Universal stress protein family n=1 Tax=Nonomuraea gerenzanensis TaxID=93944 RepID=A0A1M4EFB9_9ACTN|nr:universal stress protein [Nonomuraea gerenzanensis]UBU08985.1 universal stress protein [Nonomuraea gerenzanensis]SBO97368.1 Universal stress protein family [Nonomuraea gerenzanensis]